MKDDIMKAVIIAILLAVLGKAWQTYETVIELRGDVDRLYAIVSEDIQER